VYPRAEGSRSSQSFKDPAIFSNVIWLGENSGTRRGTIRCQAPLQHLLPVLPIDRGLRPYLSSSSWTRRSRPRRFINYRLQNLNEASPSLSKQAVGPTAYLEVFGEPKELVEIADHFLPLDGFRLACWWYAGSLVTSANLQLLAISASTSSSVMACSTLILGFGLCRRITLDTSCCQTAEDIRADMVVERMMNLKEVV
jgi:hypothetical protein